MNTEGKPTNETPSLGWIRRDWVWLALIGLLFQLIWAWQLQHPSYMDAYYYTTNGRRLAQGYGFSEQIIWQYLDHPQGLPTPSHTYWMPLTSLITAVGYTLSDHFRAAQLPFWLMAGLLPLLTYLISLQFTQARWQVWVACLFTIIGGYYSRFLSQPSTFAPFAWAGASCLLFLVWSHTQPQKRWWFLAGLSAGLAHLTRADGVLFLFVAGGLWLLGAVKTRSQLKQHALPLACLVAGYLLIMGGWFGHNWQLFARPLPISGGQTLFLTNYDDIFAYGRQFDLAHFLAWGWPNILQSKWQGISLALQTFVAVCCLIFLCPFVLWSWQKWARQADNWPKLRPLTLYTLLLFAAMSLFFTLPGQRGGLFHSSAALWPWMTVLAAGGINFAVDFAAARLPHWQPATAKKMFSALFLLVALIITMATSGNTPDLDAELVAQIDAVLPPTAVVVAGNAPGFYYHTGRPSLSVPNESTAVFAQLAADFGATHLVLDHNHPQPLADLYQSETAAGLQHLQTFGSYKLFQIQPSPAP